MQRLPERGVAADGREGVDERGVEPLAAALPHDVVRRLRAGGGVEDLGGLGQAEDPPEQRDLLAAQAARLAAAVPVLVERSDPVRRLGVEAEHQGDLGAALAARLHQRARDLALGLDGAQAVDPAADPALGRDRAQRPEERRQPPGPVDPLRRALGDVVVGVEQRRHLGRVGRAARVLEQQCVEQVRARRGVELQLLREPHADLAAADRVPRRLPLREVERVRQRADHLRERDPLTVAWHRKQ